MESPKTEQRIMEKARPAAQLESGPATVVSTSVRQLQGTPVLAVAQRTSTEVVLTQKSLIVAAQQTKPSVSQTELQKYHTM